MRNTILNLVKQWMSIGYTQKEYLVTEDKSGQRTIRITEQRNSVIWQCYNDREKPDDQMVEFINTKKEEIIANRLYHMTLEWLRSNGVITLREREDSRKTLTNPHDKYYWSLNILFKENIVSPKDVINLSTIEDGDGRMVGARTLKPQDQEEVDISDAD